MRQWNLLRLREELHRRGITPETFESGVTNVTKQLRKTTYQPIHNALELGKSANCVLLKGFKKLLRWQTQTDTYFGREISDRVRVIACLTTLPNIIHSDSTSETISAMEWQKIRKSAGASNDDTMVIVWGDERDIDMAAKEIASRAKEATIGIPSETRQALRDGTNGFERILPGPERMYPDTDLPPKKITKEKTDRLRLQLPEYYWKSEGWYKELKIPEDVINPLAISKYSLLFKKIVGELKINPVLASVVLIQFPKRLKKKKLDFNNLTIETIEEIFKAYKDGLMTKEGIYKEIEKAIINNGQFVKENITPVIKEKELSQVISHCGKELKDFKYHDVKNKKKILTAFVMRKVIGRFDAEKAVKTVITSGKEKKQ
jgi:Archaeal Glu-tRNAGln amidotransferase subunit E (contains GAD domain)